MPPPPPYALTEDLLQHAASLRKLARDLVHSPDRADDAVQETYLRALKNPPSERAGLLPWLSTVLRNVVRNHHRGERRRALREALVAPTDASGPSTGDGASHAETVHRLTGALRALPEPYRTTLTQRYFADRTPTQIARSTDTPLPTVKSRLARGLDLLRRELDASTPDRDWRAALLPAVGLSPTPTTAAVSAPLLPTLLLMAPTTKLLFGGAAAITVAAALWLWLDRGAGPAPLPTTARSERLVDARADLARGDVGATANVRTDAAPQSPVSDGADLLHPHAYTVRVTACDRDGVRVTNAGLALATAGTVVQLVPAESVAPGVYEFRFRARHPSLQARIGLQHQGVGRTLREVALTGGVPFVTTMLIETADGHEPCSPGMRATTSNCSSCHVGGAGVPGLFDARTFAGSFRHPAARFCEILPRLQRGAPEASDGPDLVLKEAKRPPPATPLPRLRGVVRGHDGTPLSGVRVTWGHATDVAEASTRSRDDGSYDLHHVGLGDIELRAGGGRHGIARLAMQVHEGTDRVVDLLLQPGTRLRGTVLLPDGASPDRWRVRWRAHDGTSVDGAWVGPDGAFVLANLTHPSGELLLCTPTSRLPVARLADVVAGSAVEFDLRETGLPNGSIRCELRRSDDRALARPIVQRRTQQGEDIEWTAHETIADGHADLFVTREDSGDCTQAPWVEGTLRLDTLGPGFYRITAAVPGGAPVDLGRHWLDGASELDLGVHTLPAPGRVTLQFAEGTPHDIELYLRRTGLDVRVHGFEPPRETSAELPPGTWLLLGGPADAPWTREFDVRSDRETGLDLR